MNKYINILIDNGDFNTVAEFEEAAETSKNDLLDFLTWRANGGTFKNETTAPGYKEACTELVNKLS